MSGADVGFFGWRSVAVFTDATETGCCADAVDEFLVAGALTGALGRLEAFTGEAVVGVGVDGVTTTGAACVCGAGALACVPESERAPENLVHPMYPAAAKTRIAAATMSFLLPDPPESSPIAANDGPSVIFSATE